MRLEDKREGVKCVSGGMRAEECAVTGRQQKTKSPFKCK